MLRIAICEDDVNQLENLSDYLNKVIMNNNILNDVEIVYLANTFEKMNDFICHNYADLYIIDIELKDAENRTGFELAKQIRIQSKNAFILFTTAYNSYMRNAFVDIKAYDYFVKPFDFDLLGETFIKIYHEYKSTLPSSIDIRDILSDGSIYTIKLSSIICAEKITKHRIKLITIDGTYQTTTKLNEIERHFNNSILIRIHKSFLINIERRKIINLKENKVIMENGYECSIGRENNRDNLIKYLKNDD